MPEVIYNRNNKQSTTNQPNGLVSGGVEWIEGLTFLVTILGYYLNNTYYQTNLEYITLQDADATHGRIDVFIADLQGNVGVLMGTPSANPIKPEINPLNQIELTFVLIPANATQPNGITAAIVYAENAGTPNEWATASNGGSVTFNNTADPAAGTNAIAIQNYSSGDTFTFTNNELVTISNLSGLKFKIKNAVSELGMLVRMYNGSTAVSGEFTVIFKVDTYGYSLGVSGYQDIVIPASDFGFTDTLFDKIEFRLLEVISSPSNSTHYIDNVELVYDGNDTSTNGNCACLLPPKEWEGTVIPIDRLSENYNNTPQTATGYTIGPGAIDGGSATWLVDTTGLTAFPTVTGTGVSLRSGSAFEAGETYEAFIKQFGNTGENGMVRRYYFIKS